MDPKIGTRFDNSISYSEWMNSKFALNYGFIVLKLDDYRVDSDHDTLTFNVIANEAQGRNRSFNSRIENMAVELGMTFYLLDENQLCYDKVFKFTRISQFPSTLTVDIPHENRLKYIEPYCKVQWYVRH